MTKIKSVKTREFTLEMKSSLAWGKSSQLNELRHVLVSVELDNGIIGYSEAPPRPTILGETVASIESIISEELAPRIIGMDLSRGRELEAWNKLSEVKNNPTAKGAIDIALYDAMAKSEGLTLAEYLGVKKSRVKVSYILGLAAIEDSLQEAQEVYSRGVRCLKVKVANDIALDLKRIETIKNALPEDLELYADANQSLAVDRAVDILTTLSNRGISWCEEPIAISNIAEREALKSLSPMLIIADDSCMTLADLQREIHYDTFDILNIKTPRTGFTESLQMLQLAKKHNKQVMIGSHACSGLGASHALVFSALAGIDLPCEASFFLKLKGDSISPSINIQDGYVEIDSLTSQINL